MTQVVGIRFERAGKIYYFSTGELDLTCGDRVIVESSRGQDMGTVVTQPQDIDETTLSTPLRPVLRPATPADEQRAEAFKAKEPEAYDFCLQQIEAFNLPMKLIRAEYSFDGSRLVFYFSANGRVDFRELVKALAAKLHTRIELRQIGVRDEARLVGGYSTCGRELCCAAFLENFRPVSIKMAKQQNIALNPAKISGVCGRLMCCLSYEKDTEDEMECRRCKAEAAAAAEQAAREAAADLTEEQPAPETRDNKERRHHKPARDNAPKDNPEESAKENRRDSGKGHPKGSKPHHAKDTPKPQTARENTKNNKAPQEPQETGEQSTEATGEKPARPVRPRRPRPQRSPRKPTERSGEGDPIVDE